MPGRQANPYKVKQHRSYTVGELAACLGVHKNSIRNWQRKGLEPIDRARPMLFAGADVRAFLLKQRANRKQPCPPGTFYCFTCREPRRPKGGLVFFVPLRLGSGNASAVCEVCGTGLNKRVREADIEQKMRGCNVQHQQEHSSLSGKDNPSLHCDFEQKG